MGSHSARPPSTAPHCLVADRRRHAAVDGGPGRFPLQPERWQLNEPKPGVGGCPLFQPGHLRVDQLLLVTPEGDEDDVPLAGRSGRQCHLASAVVTGRQLRERYPVHYLGVRWDAAWRSPGARAGTRTAIRSRAAFQQELADIEVAGPETGLRVGEVEVPHALEGGARTRVAPRRRRRRVGWVRC